MTIRHVYGSAAEPRPPVRAERPPEPPAPPRIKSNGNGHRPKVNLRTKRFRGIVSTIKKQGEVAGFRQLRDRLLLDYEQLGEPLGTVLKLALESSKHALMVELHEAKNSGGDAKKYEEFQRYLHGQTELPPTPTIHGQVVAVSAAPADTADEPEGGDDGEEEE